MNKPFTASKTRSAFTLVEMLVAMAITLVLMAAVVTLFANVSKSIQNRRALIEVDSQLRQVRNMLQQDLANATCPALTWQRPENNRGYIEIIEGLYSDQNPSMYTDGNDDSENDGFTTGTPASPFVVGQSPDELDIVLSFVPRGPDPDNPDGPSVLTAQFLRPTGGGVPARGAVNGLGDWDDILALTCRNEAEPFIGRVPPAQPQEIVQRSGAATEAKPFDEWHYETIRSPLAEVVWFAVENPMNDTGRFMGEPGFRTIYRRVFLIAPWLNPYRDLPNESDRDSNEDPDTDPVLDSFNDLDGVRIRSRPGLVRVLPNSVDRDELPFALAALIAFQERYDLSVRLEFDPTLGADGRYVILANTLADLTKRENRYGHVGFRYNGSRWARTFPFSMISGGANYSDRQVEFVRDPELIGTGNDAEAVANLSGEDTVLSYSIDPDNLDLSQDRVYLSRPFAYVNDEDAAPGATANAILNDDGHVVHVTKGPVPLWGPRRAEDVVLSNVLAFDLRVYDPGAPLYADPGHTNPSASDFPGTVLQPGDAGWPYSAMRDTENNSGDSATDIADDPDPVSVGAYVDLGYWNGYVGLFVTRGYWSNPNTVPVPHSLSAPGLYGIPTSVFSGWMYPKSQFEFVSLNNYPLYPYRVFDTWSFHYENNGLNEDADEVENSVHQLNDGDNDGMPMIDESTNGLDEFGNYVDAAGNLTFGTTALGPDDAGERETSPPYDVALRGIQVKIRVYERDSRQIRESVVQQHFVPE